MDSELAQRGAFYFVKAWIQVRHKSNNILRLFLSRSLLLLLA